MEGLIGRRLLTLTFLIRVNQIEARLDKNLGFDETSLHSAESMRQVRELLAREAPGCKITWAFSDQALLSRAENYAAMRELARSYMERYQDEATFVPGGFFANMYNTLDEVNAMLQKGAALVEAIFGQKPKSVVAGFLAAPNQQYLADVLGIHVCQGQIWSQMGIDNGDGEGGIVYPYYPSTEHYLKPAQGAGDRIDCVCVDGWTVDFLCATKAGVCDAYNSRLGVGPIETTMKFGAEVGVFEQMAVLDAHFRDGFARNGFALVTVNWEMSLFNCQSACEPLDCLRRLLRRARREYPRMEIDTLANAGEAWRRDNPDNSRIDYRFVQQGTGVWGSDPDKRIAWFMNRDFRFATLSSRADRTCRVIDFTDYTLPAREPTEVTRNWSLLGLLNQKGLREQDRPIPFSALPAEIQEKILHRYPHCLEPDPA